MRSLLISSTKKSSGKTIISIGVAGLAHKLKYTTQTFKKGPDYIDPSWLKLATGRQCYNLDFNTMTPKEIANLYSSKIRHVDLGVIEGTKGLFDGIATDGTDSNAELAKLIKTEVLLVIDCQGITRGIAPLLQGYKQFDKKLKMNKVILNNVSTQRHESKLIAAINKYTNYKVIGSVPSINSIINERHLGLIPSFQHPEKNKILTKIVSVIKSNVDYDKIFPKVKKNKIINKVISVSTNKKNKKFTIGVVEDSAFGFYYADDIEKIINLGHKIKKINLIKDKKLPKLDGLFIGGGFPETQAKLLENNISMRKSIKEAIENNLVVYAECGGLMYLAKTIKFKNKITKMCNIFDVNITMNDKPIGRGCTILDSKSHPWNIQENCIHAHEFHYSSIKYNKKKYKYAYDIKRGYGINGRNDGLVYKNALASFSHLRATKSFDWISYFIKYIEKHNG